MKCFHQLVMAKHIYTNRQGFEIVFVNEKYVFIHKTSNQQHNNRV